MALATRRPLLYSLFDIIIELFALTKHRPERREKFGEGEGYYCFFIEESRFQDRLNAQEARGKGVEQPAGGWTRGVIAACSRHPRRLVQTQRRVISRGVGGGERRQSGALEKRLSAVKNAAELLVCLARYKRPGSWCAFRNKHAATARPPVLWRNPRAVKKKKETFREKTVYRSLLLILTLALLAFTHVSQSGLSFSRIELGQIVLSFFLFFEKKVSFWRMFFTPENFSLE